MHLKKLGFTYSACGSFTKNQKRGHLFKEARDYIYFCQNKLDKASFQYDMTYGALDEAFVLKYSF